jgi:hypothetical protein
MSKRIIDIADDLEYVNKYNTNGTNTNLRITTTKYGEFIVYSTSPSFSSSIGSIVVLNGGISINGNQNATATSAGGSLTVAGGVGIGKDLIGAGNVIVSGGSVNVLGTGSIGSFLISSGTVNASGDINFRGNLYQNGVLFSSAPTSEWGTGTGGNLFYTSGNVGINTTAPEFRLDVSGTSRVTNGITTGAVTIVSTGSFNTLTGTNIFVTNMSSSNVIVFATVTPSLVDCT